MGVWGGAFLRDLLGESGIYNLQMQTDANSESIESIFATAQTNIIQHSLVYRVFRIQTTDFVSAAALKYSNGLYKFCSSLSGDIISTHDIPEMLVRCLRIAILSYFRVALYFKYLLIVFNRNKIENFCF